MKKMIEQYIQICELLDSIGHFKPRLEMVQEIIQKPDFQYNPLECPKILTRTFICSSYWLDKELFDESYLYKKNLQNLSSMQQNHMQMINIGALLLSKGFPLEYEQEKMNIDGPKNLIPYAKTFVEQCHKRKAFLEKKITKKRNVTKLSAQKILA